MGVIYRRLARPLLFQLPPEAAHYVAIAALRARPLWRQAGRLWRVDDPRLAVDLCGIPLPSPVGLAAGFDKDCKVLPSLLDLGFGFVVGGTVTRHPRPGNSRPRMVRDPQRQAIINALGFPGEGLARAEARLRRLPPAMRGRIFVSVSGTEESDIAACHRALEPLAAAVEVNISSPNTAGLAAFQQPVRLRQLLEPLCAGKTKPLFVKLPRLDDMADLLKIAGAAVEAGADGLVAANTRPVSDSRLAPGRGGLSGPSLFQSTLEAVVALRAEFPEKVAIIACGGVATGGEAKRLLLEGANAVQLYTAFVYEGPGLPGGLNRELLRLAELSENARPPSAGGIPPP